MRVQQKVTELAIKGDRALGRAAPGRGDAGLGHVRRRRAAAAATAGQHGHRAAAAGRTALGAATPDAGPLAERRAAAAGRARCRGGAADGRRADATDRRTTTRPRPNVLPGYRDDDHPAAARASCAQLERRRPARAAGLGDRARQPAAVRHDARATGSPRSPRRDRAARRNSRGAAVAGPHGRPQDRRVGRPARRGVGGGPARAGHRPARHRAPRSSCCATRPPTCRCSSRRPIGLVRDGGPGRGRGRPGRRPRQAVVLPRPRHARACGSTRSAPSASASCWPASSGCARCWPPRACSTRPASAGCRSCPAASAWSPAGRRPPSTTCVIERDGALAGGAVPDRATPPTQGALAVPQIVDALGALDRDPEVDVIVLARGGGSVEDLLPFSDETLCRAVAACRTPVVSAIGHEPDTPLVDHVADLRCSTPTEAGRAAGARPRRGDRADRRPARPGPPRAGRLGGPGAAAARCAARPPGAGRPAARPGRTARRGRPAARRPPGVRRCAGWTGAAPTSRTCGARLTALGPAATLARGYAVVQRVPDARRRAAAAACCARSPRCAAATRLRIRVGRRRAWPRSVAADADGAATRAGTDA